MFHHTTRPLCWKPLKVLLMYIVSKWKHWFCKLFQQTDNFANDFWMKVYLYVFCETVHLKIYNDFLQLGIYPWLSL